jgi:hypothetical protein
LDLNLSSPRLLPPLLPIKKKAYSTHNPTATHFQGKIQISSKLMKTEKKEEREKELLPWLV